MGCIVTCVVTIYLSIYLSAYPSAFLSTLTGSAQNSPGMFDFRRKSLDIWASTVETHLLVAFEICKPCAVLYFDPVSVSLLQQPPQNNRTISFILHFPNISPSVHKSGTNTEKWNPSRKGWSGWNPFNQILSLEFMMILPGMHLSHEKVSKQKRFNPPTTEPANLEGVVVELSDP